MDTTTMRTLLITIATIAICICQSFADSVPGCKTGHFYNHDVGHCVRCTECSNNKVPFKRCYIDQDTICGTLGGKFEFRQSAPISQKSQELPVSNQLPSTPTSEHTDATVMYADSDSNRKWFTITIVLVTVLVLVCVAGVVVLFAVCLLCRKKQREIVCDPVLGTDSSASLKDGGRYITLRPVGNTIEQFRLISET